MISILIPTRGRSTKLRSLIENIFYTAEYPTEVEIRFYVDEDDTQTRVVLDDQVENGPEGVNMLQGPRIIFSDMWNQLLKIVDAKADIFMICGDDVEFRTKGWDTIVRNKFYESKDKIIYVCPNDLIQGEKLGVHGFVHKNWVDTLGYITPNMLSYYFVDDWTDDVAKMIKRKVYLPELVIAHTHHTVGASVYDTTYKENAVKNDINNRTLYDSLLPMRQNAADKLMNFIVKSCNRFIL